jgi:hypothetical protein
MLPSSLNYTRFSMPEGLVSRDVALAGMGCTESLGPGDILRPADQHEGSPPCRSTSRFRRRAGSAA